MTWSTIFLPFKQKTPALTLLRLKSYFSLPQKLSLNYHPCVSIVPLVRKSAFLNKAFPVHHSSVLIIFICSLLSLHDFSAFLCPALSCRKPASSDYIIQQLIPFGSSDLDKSKQWEEIRGWRNKISGNLFSYPWPLPFEPFLLHYSFNRACI